MEMHQIRYFLAVCEELNFTRAAERSNVAQPSLTRAIKLLEEEMGGELFSRERGNTHLTELGLMVRPFLTEIYDQAQTAKREALDFIKLRRAALRLGIMCTVAPTNLLDLIGRVRHSHPGIELEMLDAKADLLVEDLLRGTLEVAILAQPGREPDERLHYLPLFRERFVIVVHPGHRLAKLEQVRVRDLNGERYLNRINCEWNGPAAPILADAGTTLAVVYQSERDDWIMSMAAAGLGFGFMPEFSIRGQGIVARPLVEPEFTRDVAW